MLIESCALHVSFSPLVLAMSYPIFVIVRDPHHHANYLLFSSRDSMLRGVVRFVGQFQPVAKRESPPRSFLSYEGSQPNYFVQDKETLVRPAMRVALSKNSDSNRAFMHQRT
ncbi:hypothetical protein GOP47_0025685 [Adiantum capillus-veneris]|uniref:Uncharacterized protein n=1 Tax=Adiantum capillus-veneris TaxID=13818 RepID=A0A9D4Z4C7_ADICA|nr:hypothetical protein GOP47_0025685 [Adiantum capillus-veneris]